MVTKASTSDPRTTTVVAHLSGSATVKQRTADFCAEAIVAAAGLITESFRACGKLLLCGNGGSAADCQHLAAEFTSRLSADFLRPGLPALALTTDTSFLTAYANDFDFDGVFARQVQALGKPGDVLLGISTSGRSKNVVQAAELAKRMGLSVIALTGSLVVPPSGSCAGVPPSGGSFGASPSDRSVPPPEGGTPASSVEAGTTNGSGRMPLLRWADVAICIPSHNTQHIQEAHLAVEHILCHLVERLLFGDHGAGDWESHRVPRPLRAAGALEALPIPTRSASGDARSRFFHPSHDCFE